MKKQLFTVGHSNHSTEDFLSLLQKASISAVADVRSHPRSAYNPDFDANAIKEHLFEIDIQYIFLGVEFGARSINKNCYQNGKVVYSKLAEQPEFKRGIDRLEIGVQKYRIALMCAERDPLNCHRAILVSRYLIERGFDVTHILANGSYEPHDESVRRLVSLHGLNKQSDMFRSDAEIVNIAYELQEERIAYQKQTNESPVKVA